LSDGFAVDLIQEEIILQSPEVVSFEEDHPLYDIQRSLDFRLGKVPCRDMGVYYEGLGKDDLKRGMIHVAKKNVEFKEHFFKEIIWFDMRLNYHTRSKLEEVLNFIRCYPDKWRELFPPHIRNKIKLFAHAGYKLFAKENVWFKNGGDLGDIFLIEIEGIGYVRIGTKNTGFNRII